MAGTGRAWKAVAGVVVAVMVVSSILAVFVHVAKDKLPGGAHPAYSGGGMPEVDEVSVPLGEGDVFLLVYSLYTVNGSNRTLVDTYNVTVVVERVTGSVAITSVGVLPLSFFFPVRVGDEYVYTFVSHFFDDTFCTLAFPRERGVYAIAPREGCSMVTGTVRLGSDGVLRSATLIVATNPPTVETVDVVYHIHRNNTTVRLEPVCRGPFSPAITFTAPGLYVKNGSRLYYYGKLPDRMPYVLIVLDKASGKGLWEDVWSFPDGSYIFVWSPLTSFTGLEHPAVYVDGELVAVGSDEVLEWLEENANYTVKG